jgi:GT2 family glycosyltransferase
VSTGLLMLASDEAGLLEHSLPAALAEGFDEALLIDNASGDGTAELARRLGVERLALSRRAPYTEAMNAGLREIGTDFVAMLQADTFVSPGYRESCVRALSQHPQAGSVAPKLLRTLGPRVAQHLPIIDAAAMTIDRRRKNSLIGHGQPSQRYSTPGPVFGADGAGAMWRLEAIRDCTIDGEVFDENMPGWGCDADLAWRARLLGWDSRYEPSAVVHHIRTYSPSTRAFVTGADRRTQFRNRYLMIAKNDSLSDLLHDAPRLLAYEVLAFGYALLREPELLRGYLEALARLPGALRRRRRIQARRRVRRVPFGLEPVPEAEAAMIAGGEGRLR